MKMYVQKKYLRQLLAVTSASLTLFVCSAWVAWPSSSIRKLDHRYEDVDQIGLRMSESEITWMVCLPDLGNALSSIFSSFIMNMIGRKNTILLASLFFLPSWLLVYDSTSLVYVYTARFIIGLSKGLCSTAVPVYVGEIADCKIRGLLASSVHSFMVLGVLFSLSLGPYVNYRTLNISLSVIPILFLCIYSMMPESQYYYIMKKDYVSAEKSLAWFRHYSSTIKEDLKAMIDNHALLEKEKASFVQIVKHRATRKPLIIVLGVSFFQRFSGISALVAYTSTTLPVLSFTWFGPSECVLVFTLSMAVSNIVFASYLDTLGRKCLLCFSIIGGAVLQCLTSVYYHIYPKATGHYTDIIPYALNIAYGINFFGMGSVPPCLPSEYFRTSHRSFASAGASVAFAMGSFITGKFYIILQEEYGLDTLYLLFSSIHVVYFVFAWTLLIETKGKSLEEIQMMFVKAKTNKEDIESEGTKNHQYDDSEERTH